MRARSSRFSLRGAVHPSGGLSSSKAERKICIERQGLLQMKHCLVTLLRGKKEYDGIAYIHGLGKALWERTPWLRTGDDSHTAGSEADRELLCGLGVKFVESYELVPYLYRMEKYSNNNTTRQPDFLPCSALDRFHSRRLCLLEIYFIFCPLKVMTLIFAFGKVFGFHKT